MRLFLFGLTALLMMFLAEVFGIAAMMFVIGHLWLPALINLGLAFLSSLMVCFYSALLAYEWLKDRVE